MIRAADSRAPHEPCLADYVEGLFDPRDPEARLNEMAVREVATALEAYAAAEEGEVIDSERLAFLAASAVHALGREDLAVDAVIMGTGAVYRQDLESAEGGTVWVINTERLFPDLKSCTELAFFSVLYHLVGQMLHLWDSSDGKGVLGLKRLRAVASVFAGRGPKKQASAWVERIIDAVCKRLEQCSLDRGWTGVPRVMMLD